MEKNLQSGISGQGSASPKKRILVIVIGLAILVGVIGFAFIQSQEGGANKGPAALAQNEESPQGKEEAVQGSSSNKDVVFDGKTLDDLAALEEIVTDKLDKKQLAKMSKEEREAFEKAKSEAEIAWGKYREHYLQQMEEANIERAKQGKELYQEFLIPRGTATYMEYAVKVEDLKADVHDGVYGFKMGYRYFVPEIGEEEKVPLILFLHSIDWQSRKRKDPWPPRNGTDNRYQFKSPEILAFVQPEVQAKYPCFLVAPQQLNDGPWASPIKPSGALQNAVGIVNVLIEKYPQIDTNRLYVTGGSVGGAGAMDAVAKYPNKFAAVAAMSGATYPYVFKEKQKTTAWISYFEEGEFASVPDLSKGVYDLFSCWGGDSRLVVYPGKGVNSWKLGYADKNFYKWLFQQSL